MAHSCPECGRLCYCDGEDIDYGDNCNEDCIHQCEEDDLGEDDAQTN